MKNKTRKKLVLCSYGLHPRQATLEAVKAMKACGVVFSDGNDAWHSGKLREAFGGIKLANETVHEPDVLRRIDAKIRRVLDAFKKHDRVGFMVYGHPSFLCNMGDALRARCAAEDIACEVVPGVSSLNTVLDAAGVSDFPGGVSLFSAPAADNALYFKDTGAHVFVFLPLNIKNFPLFVKNLKARYPGGHELRVIETDSMAAPGKDLRVRVADARRLPGLLTDRSTLYIPPLPAARGRRR